MKNRKLVYILTLLFTVALGASAVAQVPPTPENPDTYTTATPVTIELNTDLTVTATLVNDNDEALPDQEITFILGKDEDGDGNIDQGTEIVRDTAITDSSGYAETTFTPSETGFTAQEDLGDYTYKAYYAGSSDPEYASSQDTATVTVEPVVESITVSTQPDTMEYYSGESLDLTGLVIRACFKDAPTGLPVQGRSGAKFTELLSRLKRKRESCVLIHIYTHSDPGGGLVD